MAQRKTKCPKCSKPARKEKKLMTLKGKDKMSHSWRIYVHREEVAMGFHIIHECCYVEEIRPTKRAADLLTGSAKLACVAQSANR